MVCAAISALLKTSSQASGNSSTRWAPRSTFCSTTQTSTSPPPKASMVASPQAGLGWNWSLGKTTRCAGLKAVPPVIPHRSTIGWRCKLKERTPMAQLSIRPWPRSTRTVSAWRVGAMPGSNSAAPEQIYRVVVETSTSLAATENLLADHAHMKSHHPLRGGLENPADSLPPGNREEAYVVADITMKSIEVHNTLIMCLRARISVISRAVPSI